MEQYHFCLPIIKYDLTEKDKTDLFSGNSENTNVFLGIKLNEYLEIAKEFSAIKSKPTKHAIIFEKMMEEDAVYAPSVHTVDIQPGEHFDSSENPVECLFNSVYSLSSFDEDLLIIDNPMYTIGGNNFLEPKGYELPLNDQVLYNFNSSYNFSIQNNSNKIKHIFIVYYSHLNLGPDGDVPEELLG
mgnify:CR=1 FL=1